MNFKEQHIMPSNRLYSYQEVISATYYDVIEMMGSEGLDSKLTAYDLLAVMAAPCTRLDYENTDKSKITAMMSIVHSFMIHNRRITSLTHRGLVAELNRSLLPTLSEEQQKNLLSKFRLVMGFDVDGYAIFNKQTYDIYKGNMDRGTYTKIKYFSFTDKKSGSGLPDKEITKTYQVANDEGLFHMNLDIKANEWIDILRGASAKAMQLICAFTQLEDKRATITEIEEKFGINRDSINGVTAGLGNRAKRIMGIEVLGADGNPSCWILPFNNGKDVKGRGFVWELRPEVEEAYKFLTK